jgi:hypothetical protein
VSPAIAPLLAMGTPGTGRMVGSTAKLVVAAPNTSGALGTTRRRNSGCRRALRSRTRRPETGLVSGAFQHRTADRATTTRCAKYGTTAGAGSHWARTPATSGPPPKPAERAPAARRAPPPSDNSLIHALPGPKAAPEATPATSRPRPSSQRLSAPKMRITEASADNTNTGRITPRRPSRADSGAPTSKAGIKPITYAPNTAATSEDDRWSRSR